MTEIPPRFRVFRLAWPHNQLPGGPKWGACPMFGLRRKAGADESVHPPTKAMLQLATKLLYGAGQFNAFSRLRRRAAKRNEWPL